MAFGPFGERSLHYSPYTFSTHPLRLAPLQSGLETDNNLSFFVSYLLSMFRYKLLIINKLDNVTKNCAICHIFKKILNIGILKAAFSTSFPQFL